MQEDLLASEDAWLAIEDIWLAWTPGQWKLDWRVLKERRGQVHWGARWKSWVFSGRSTPLSSNSEDRQMGPLWGYGGPNLDRNCFNCVNFYSIDVWIYMDFMLIWTIGSKSKIPEFPFLLLVSNSGFTLAQFLASYLWFQTRAHSSKIQCICLNSCNLEY